VSKKIKDLMAAALQAIDDDRSDAKSLLGDISKQIGLQPDRYITMGMTAAKYLEVMQRSNEQRVKLLAIMAKNSDDGDFGEVDDKEVEEIYEQFEDEDLSLGKTETEDGD